MTLRTDLEIVQLPGTYPNVGGLTGANTIVTDPDFGTTITRLTDGNSGSGNYSSMQTADNPSGYTMWNCDDTLIISRNNGGIGFLFQWNPATLQGTQLTGANYQVSGPYCFSRVQPGVLYVVNGTVLNSVTYVLVDGVWTYQSTVEIVDFATILPAGFTVSWHSELGVSQADSVFSVAFSEGAQDTGYYACLYKAGAGLRMINTQTLAVTGAWGTTGTATLQNTEFTSFFLHGFTMTPNPNYTVLSPVGGTSTFVWANQGLVLTQSGLTGHHGLGYLHLYTGGPGGGQYDGAPFSNPTSHSPIIPRQVGPPGLPANQVPPQSYKGDQHSAFCPVNLNDKSLLFITNGPPQHNPMRACWEQEVRAIDVTGAVSGAKGTVYRICHTYNSGLSLQYIVTNSQLGVSQTGNFVAFTSDWGGGGTVGPLGSTSGAATGTLGVDARGDVFIAALNTTIVVGGVSISTSSLPLGVIEAAYSATVIATGGISPYSWAVTAGSLPPGLSLSASGAILGTPTAAGTFTFTVTVTDSESPTPSTASAALSITINAALEIITPAPSLPGCLTGASYNQTLQASGGISPYTWALSSGTLPPGLTLSSNGQLAGTPTTAGSFTFTVAVMDSEMPSPATQTATFTIVIAAAPYAVPAGTILPALYAQLASSLPILQLIGPGAYNSAPLSVVNAFFFGAAGKQTPQRFIVINVFDGTPAATTLDQTTALKGGEFQFDSYAENQLVARQISETVRDLLIDLVGATLPNGTTITFTENTVDRDLGYELGGESYVFRSMLRLSAFYTEGSSTLPLPPGANLYTGYGAPSTLHNNDDLYYDLATGNIYEQQSYAWDLVGTITGGGNLNRYDNASIGGITISGSVATLAVAVKSTAQIYRNGELAAPEVDYTYSGSAITFNVTLNSDDVITVLQ